MMMMMMMMMMMIVLMVVPLPLGLQCLPLDLHLGQAGIRKGYSKGTKGKQEGGRKRLLVVVVVVAWQSMPWGRPGFLELRLYYTTMPNPWIIC